MHATSCARPHGTAKWAAYVYIRTYVAARRLRCVACVGNWGQRSSEHTQELNFENILFVQFLFRNIWDAKIFYENIPLISHNIYVKSENDVGAGGIARSKREGARHGGNGLAD